MTLLIVNILCLYFHTFVKNFNNVKLIVVIHLSTVTMLCTLPNIYKSNSNN